MKKTLLFGLLSLSAAAVLLSCSAGKKTNFTSSDLKPASEIRNIIYLNPEIDPAVEEIKDPTYAAFFSTVSDEIGLNTKHRLIRVNNTMKYDSIDCTSIKEFCANNDSQLVIVPKVKYFKVGIGKYVFSNQVMVSLKLFDAEGNYIMESSYNTYKGKGRLLGSTENSIKIGTKNAMRLMSRELRSHLNALAREQKKAS